MTYMKTSSLEHVNAVRLYDGTLFNFADNLWIEVIEIEAKIV